MEQKTGASNHETNPLKLVWSGIKKLYNRSPVTFWVLLIVSIVGGGSNLTTNQGTPPQKNQDIPTPALDAGEVAFILLLILFLVSVLIGLVIVFWGIIGYSAHKLAKNESFSLKEAFESSLEHFERLFLVGLVMIIRILGWTLLFIIPGIIMAVRYSLSAVVAFAEPDLQPGQVVSRSAFLTKNAWFHTAGTRGLFSGLTLGLFDMVVDAAAQSQLYRQLTALKKTGDEKPKTHILSYLTIPIVIALMVIAFSILVSQYPEMLKQL